MSAKIFINDISREELIKDTSATDVVRTAHIRQIEVTYMNTVRDSGKMLAKNLHVNIDNVPQPIIDAFTIANDWRTLHAYPMKSLRLSVMACMRKHNIIGITSARLKRMPAIREKLRRGSVHLDKLQDIGGCRAILKSIDDVSNLVDGLRNYGRHHIWKENNYISDPKNDGYRSYHLAFEFQDSPSISFRQ